jgi:hypothetical protein
MTTKTKKKKAKAKVEAARYTLTPFKDDGAFDAREYFYAVWDVYTTFHRVEPIFVLKRPLTLAEHEAAEAVAREDLESRHENGDPGLPYSLAEEIDNNGEDARVDVLEFISWTQDMTAVALAYERIADDLQKYRASAPKTVAEARAQRDALAA